MRARRLREPAGRRLRGRPRRDAASTRGSSRCARFSADRTSAAYAPAIARWIADRYLCPLSEALRLFTPPGGTPARRHGRSGDGGDVWELRRAGVGPVDDRWASSSPGRRAVRARAPARRCSARSSTRSRRARCASRSSPPTSAASMVRSSASPKSAPSASSAAGGCAMRSCARRSAPRHERLTAGQSEALAAIIGGDRRRAEGESSCSTVSPARARPRSTCGDRAGARRRAATRACSCPRSRSPRRRSAASARASATRWPCCTRGCRPASASTSGTSCGAGRRISSSARARRCSRRCRDLRLIVIDEEHESSYKQGSAPRYHAREVAEEIARRTGAVVVLGSASPSMEARNRCETGEWTRVVDARARDGPRAAAGHGRRHGRRVRGRAPLDVLATAHGGAPRRAPSGARRRSCSSTGEDSRRSCCAASAGSCPSASRARSRSPTTRSGTRLQCHHCGAKHAGARDVPAVRQPVPAPVRCGHAARRGRARRSCSTGSRSCAWTPTPRGARAVTSARSPSSRRCPSGVLLGTQMIAKGLDYPEVTLVGVINADTTLHLPDFRAGERTYQLLEQVAGRAGRGERQGEVIVQTYWPDHPAIRAAAAHDPELFYAEEEALARRTRLPAVRAAGQRARLGQGAGRRGRSARSDVYSALVAAVPDDVAAPRPEPRAALARQGCVALARPRQGARETPTSRRRSARR